MLANRVAQGVNLLIGHNGDEGFIFADRAFSEVFSDSEFDKFIKDSFSYANATFFDNVYKIYGRSGGQYKERYQRARDFISDTLVDCNTLWISRAYQSATYNYIWNVFTTSVPAQPIHGKDLCYTFHPFNLETGTRVGDLCEFINSEKAFQKAANVFQSYLTNFVRYARPMDSKVN